MREIGDEFRQNPHLDTKVEVVGPPTQNAFYIAYEKNYLKNKTVLASHTYCANQCLDLNLSKTSGNEETCFKSCVTQFGSSMQMMLAQQKQFEDMIGDIKLNGGNVYEARDI